MRNYFVNLASKKLPIISGIKRISTILLLFISYLASKFIDIGVVGSLAGGILGSSMMFVFPPLMYTRALKINAKNNNISEPKTVIRINYFLMVCGGLLGIIGTSASLLALKK